MRIECARCPNRDTGYVQTIDFIRQFRLSETHDIVPGSVQTQNAYRLTEESILSAESRQIFTVGVIPYNFWFESTFRVREQQYRPWYLIHVTDGQGVTQISVTMDAIQNVIGIGLPDNNGNVQRVFFQQSSVFDQNWHKIMVSVVKNKVKVWIDCQPVIGVRGQYEETLLPRRKFDTSNGYTHIARYVDDTNLYEYQASKKITSLFVCVIVLNSNALIIIFIFFFFYSDINFSGRVEWSYFFDLCFIQ